MGEMPTRGAGFWRIGRIITGMAGASVMLSCSPVVTQPPRQLFVYQGSGCTGKRHLPGFENFLGRSVDGVLDGVELNNWEQAIKSFSWSQRCWKGTRYAEAVAIPMLMKGQTLDQGNSGKFDNYFRDMARILIATGHQDAFLRIGWEFNGAWYPWAAHKNPDAWKTYFRRIVLLMRTTKGAKFSIVWNSAHGRQQISPELAYPGDDVVDVIAMDLYNYNINKDEMPDARWQRLKSQAYGLDWLSDFAVYHKKLLALPEWGTGTKSDGSGAGDDPAFIHLVAQWINSHPVVFHGYWDYNAKDYQSKLSGGKLPNAGRAFIEEFGPH